MMEDYVYIVYYYDGQDGGIQGVFVNKSDAFTEMRKVIAEGDYQCNVQKWDVQKNDRKSKHSTDCAFQLEQGGRPKCAHSGSRWNGDNKCSEVGCFACGNYTPDVRELRYCKQHKTIHCSCQQRQIVLLTAELEETKTGYEGRLEQADEVIYQLKAERDNANKLVKNLMMIRRI